jgi:hypothetical protein
VIAVANVPQMEKNAAHSANCGFSPRFCRNFPLADACIAMQVPAPTASNAKIVVCINLFYLSGGRQPPCGSRRTGG